MSHVVLANEKEDCTARGLHTTMCLHTMGDQGYQVIPGHGGLIEAGRRGLSESWRYRRDEEKD